MSHAEVTLGASLFVDATESGIDTMVRHGTEATEAWRFSNLRARLRDAGQFLVSRKIVARDDQGGWQVNQDAIAGLGDAEAEAFRPVWNNLVAAHVGTKVFLDAAGKKDYTAKFDEVYNDRRDFETELVPAAHVTPESAQAIASASLALLETIDTKNRLDAARDASGQGDFVLGNGLEADDVTTLVDLLRESDYVLPGDNPDRNTTLADQSLRGTPEQIGALYRHSLSMAAKIDASEGAGNGAIARAAGALREAALTANAADGPALTDRQVIAGMNSEMLPEADRVVFNLYQSALNLVDTATYAGVGSVRVNEDDMDAFQNAISAFHANDIHEAFARQDFQATALTWEDRKATLQMVEEGSMLTRDGLAAMDFSGDDGGAITEEGALATPESDLVETGRDPDLRDIDEADDGEPLAPTGPDRDMGEATYGRADPTLVIPVKSFTNIDRTVMALAGSGKLDQIREHAGIEDAPVVASGGQAAFADINDAMGADRMTAPVEVTTMASPMMSRGAWNNLNPRTRTRMRATFVTPELMNRHAAPGNKTPYIPGRGSAGRKRIDAFLEANRTYTDKDGNTRVNVPLARLMSDLNDFAVVADSYDEARALKAHGRAHVERTRAENEAWKARAWEKRGVRSYEIDGDAARRQVRVLEASGAAPETALRLRMTSDGMATLSHPDAPRIEGRPLDGAEAQPRRDVGANMTLDALKTATMAGTEKVRIMVSGETVIGAVGRRPEEEERRRIAQASAPAPRRQVVLS